MKIDTGWLRPRALVRPAPIFCAMLALALLLQVAGPQAALADPIPGYGEARPATTAEKRFIKRLIRQVNGALPLPGEGWKRDEMHVEKLKVVAEASTYLNEDGSNAMFYEYESNEPVRLSWRVKFHLPSSTESKEAEEKKQYRRSMEELQQELTAAAMRGDMEKIERLQQEMARNTTGIVESSFNPCAIAARSRPPERPGKDFHVKVDLNGYFSERIGKKFEVSVPGVKRAFRIDAGKIRTYKYFIGDWDVTPERLNWFIVFPRRYMTAANHLKALNLYVKISGERDVVEAYVRDRFRPGALKALLD